MADNGDNFFKGLIIGGILGGIAGVLLAPKSGREMREELSEEAEKLLGQVKEDMENAKKAALKSFDENKDRILHKLVHENEEPEVVEAEEEQAEVEEKRPKRKRPRRDKSKKDTE